ncbi:MAG: hypothetical protein JWP69_163 [Flaviaesturariibacter sp.]|nr:hypothetical protein [Flaviaesturariibacter sp.]
MERWAKRQKHAVWKAGFDVKECRTEKFVLQKLIYMHQNPVSGKWRLAERSIAYPHSSALYYFNGSQQGFAVQDYRALLNWEEMYPYVLPTGPRKRFPIFSSRVKRETRRGRRLYNDIP